MTVINGLDTNNQSDRDKLRDSGYYIDSSGVYAPGAGNRVGDTYSGSNSNQNTAPQGPNLPILNGHPVSPSNGFTGEQTPYIMYRGDPAYSTYFGPGTPGYQATSRTYNATPGALPPGQQTYGGAYPNYTREAPLPATAATTNQSTADTSVGPPAGYPTTGSNMALGSLTTSDNQGLGNQSQETQAAFRAIYGPNAEQAFVQQHNAEVSQQTGRPNPSQGSRPVQPVVQGTQSDTSGTPQTNSTPAPQQQQSPTQPTNQPQQQQNQQNQQGLVPVPRPDGSGVDMLPEDQAKQVQADYAKAAAAAAAATQFSQGLQQQQFDLQKAVADANKAYQEALIKYQNAQLAQQAAYQAIEVEIQRQAQQLQAQAQANQYALAAQQTENQRAQQSNQLSMQREQLNAQRQALRVGRRPAVRFA